jgi:hypothetical protein
MIIKSISQSNRLKAGDRMKEVVGGRGNLCAADGRRLKLLYSEFGGNRNSEPEVMSFAGLLATFIDIFPLNFYSYSKPNWIANLHFF